MNFFPTLQKLTMTKHNIIVLVAALLISGGIWIATSIKKPTHREVFSSTVFQTGNGWGYSIYINDALFIKQETIPGYTGKNGFQGKEEAEEAAQLIINKMKGGQRPAVTTFELEQILSSNTVQHEETGTIK